MGWKGDRCWFCHGDLSALMALDGLPDEWAQMRDAEFDRHMASECITEPRTEFERRAAAAMAEIDALATDLHR